MHLSNSGSLKPETQWFTQYLKRYLHSQGARNTFLFQWGLEFHTVYICHSRHIKKLHRLDLDSCYFSFITYFA